MRQRILREGAVPVSDALTDHSHAVWAGLAFEHFCKANQKAIAKALGFSSVKYDVGTWYDKNDQGRKAQIDLVYVRADNVVTICEIKFQSRPVDVDVIGEMEKKILVFPEKKVQTIEKVLITLSPPTRKLEDEGYFHRILAVDDVFG